MQSGVYFNIPFATSSIFPVNSQESDFEYNTLFMNGTAWTTTYSFSPNSFVDLTIKQNSTSKNKLDIILDTCATISIAIVSFNNVFDF
jgi:hypothetical protein